jgi:hypothetical protein
MSSGLPGRGFDGTPVGRRDDAIDLGGVQAIDPIVDPFIDEETGPG